MKYNCYRTLDFHHEKNRMCHTFESCDDCPLDHSCELQDEISQKEIYVVQKWSDEHPEETMEETMLEHFKKLFPNAPYGADEIPMMCPKSLGWIVDLTCDGISCDECWNEPYKENITK